MLSLNQLTHNPLARYFCVGGAAAISDLMFFQLLMTSFSSLHYLGASTLSFVLATWVNYRLGLLWLFESGVCYSRKQEMLLVYLVSFIGLIFHHISFYTCVELGQTPLLLGKVISMGFAFVWNFTARYFWIFKK